MFGVCRSKLRSFGVAAAGPSFLSLNASLLSTAKQKDKLSEYVSLRNALVEERARVEQRISAISQALQQVDKGGSVPPPVEQRLVANAPRKPKTRNPGRIDNPMSLREAVIKACSEPRTKVEVLQEVQRLGYRFVTKNPLNSIGVILYGRNPRLKNRNGKFSWSGS